MLLMREEIENEKLVLDVIPSTRSLLKMATDVSARKPCLGSAVAPERCILSNLEDTKGHAENLYIALMKFTAACADGQRK